MATPDTPARCEPQAPVATQGTSTITLAGLLACGILPTVGLFSPGLVLPQIGRHFAGLADGALLTGLVGTLASFAFAVGAPIAGRLVTRHGCRAVIVPSLAAFAISGAVPAVLDNLWLILVARGVLGLALSGIFTGTLTGIAGLPEGLRARMFGWFSMMGGGAAIALFPVVGLLGHLGWRPAFLVNLIALPVMLLAARIPAAIGRVAHVNRGAATVRPRLMTLPLAGLLAIAAITGMAMLIGPICAPLFLAQQGIGDTRMMAIPVTLGSIGSVVASGSFGWMHQRIGLSGITALTMLVMAGALLVAGTTSQVIVFSAMVVIHSAMIAMMAPNVSATALACSSPERAAEAMGLANGVMFGAQLAFPFLALAVRAHGGLSAVFLIFAGLAGVAGGWTLLGRRAASQA